MKLYIIWDSYIVFLKFNRCHIEKISTNNQFVILPIYWFPEGGSETKN